jgi:response regulator RpfG family c-di-GMP phosphodiesterase
MVHLQRDTWRVLLIDQNPFKQNLRATILRNYEIEVHTASTLTDAQNLWINNLYDLVLLAAAENSPEAVALPEQIRKSKPRQRIGLLVGAPTYVRELGGIPRRAARVSSPPSSIFAPELVGLQTQPQWQEMIQRWLGS